ncbi:NnrS family protein [Rhodoferax sp. BLA1]|uniref:NnrS family protein n=1 Tax=Rhodoferax sp. BLA1 TaxID=2576062 RepID=UPI0015D24AE2|nr:NnrS family protein [Rhodoferax sp. BLA1]
MSKTTSLPIFSTGQPATPPPKGWPLLRLGFRPFYLGGALVAALMVPLWLFLFLGTLTFTPAVSPLLWHAHEMLFGFAAAVIVGFLMTAGKNWTGLDTPRGPLLGALVLLWLAARLASLFGSALVYAVLDVALLPLVALIFASLLWRAKNYRNMPLALVLLLLATANGLFHLATLGVLDINPMQTLYAALALITVIETVIAGRVVPMFTMTVTPGLKLEASTLRERVTLALTALGLAMWVLLPANAVSAVVLALAGVAQALRLWGWRPGVTMNRPILWILHLSYAWIALALGLLALAQLGWLPVSAGVHALGLGATGGLIIGMVTRTARGHTGRPIMASKPEVVMYVLVMLATVCRVLASSLLIQHYSLLLMLAATAWSLAFGLYLWVFTPWLMATRLDGKDG